MSFDRGRQNGKSACKPFLNITGDWKSEIVALTDIHGSAQMIELLRPVLEQADTV